MNPFEQLIERRGTNCIKWDALEKVYGLEDESNILPMWVADMDFPAPPPVIEAIQQRLEHPVFGYSFPSEQAKEAIRQWLSTKHQWSIQTDWILFHQGVVPAIASVVETFTEKGEGVLITPPIYPPFFHIPTLQQRQLVECPLIETEGQYAIDFEQFEACLQKGVKLFIFCSPHNPGGLVWKEEELKEIVRLCTKYDVLILSDEIHADLVFPPAQHLPLASVAGDEADRIITCVAPTKTFNLAGIQVAMSISSSKEIRTKLQQHARAKGQIELNAFASVALEAAYSKGAEWLDELLQTLQHHIQYVRKEITTQLPSIRIGQPAGTYLLWIDYRQTGLSEKEVMDRLLHKGQLALEPGTKFGEAGRGFLRMNIAAPFPTIQEGVKRFITAFED